MFWTRAILWKIIKVLGYLIGMVRYYPARKRNIFFVPYLTRPHALRHTFCSRCFEKGITPKVVQQLMGHAHYSTTIDIYTHISEEMMGNELEKFKVAMNA